MKLQLRQLTSELMDDPELDARLHDQALTGLSRINAITRAHDRICQSVLQFAAQTSTAVRVLDVACGGGDLLRAVADSALRHRQDIELVGLDISPQAVDFARRQTRTSGRQIEFQVGDAFQLSQQQQYHIVCCSLFLHHLTEVRATELLRLMKQLATHMVLVADLQRTRAGLWYAAVGTRLLTRSRIVHVDGIKSVRAAFTIDEMRRLLASASMGEADIVRYWPQRFLVRWTRSR